MTVKWYAPAQWLGLVEDISQQYNDGYTYYTVSGKADDVFAALTLSLMPLLFGAGILVGRQARSSRTLRICKILLIAYGILIATGVGPYIQFYPQSSGFLDWSALEHLVEGIYCAFLALCLHLGEKLGNRLQIRN